MPKRAAKAAVHDLTAELGKRGRLRWTWTVDVGAGTFHIHCVAIEDLFKGQVKVTVLVRALDVPGDADVLVTNDEDVEIVRAVERRMKDEKVTR